MRNFNGCTDCDLCKYASTSGVNGVGPEDARVVVIGDAPNWSEDRSGRYGDGNPYKMLEELTQKAGLDMSEVYYTPVVKCKKPENGKISATVLKECKTHLMHELEHIKPEYVITMGATALKAVTNKAKITEIHGNVTEHKMGFKILPTFHPAMSLRDPRYYDPIFTDFKKFGKILNGEPLKEHKQNMVPVTKMRHFQRMLKDIESETAIAYDLECNGLDMRKSTSEISITVISSRTCDWVIDHSKFKMSTLRRYHKKLKDVLSRIAVKGGRISAQNGKFDNLWLYYIFGFMFPLNFDTMLASHILDENSPNGLKYQSKAVLEMEDYDVPLHIKKGYYRDGSRLKGQDLKDQYEYAAWDGYGTVRLADAFEAELLKDESIHNLFHELVMPVANTYQEIETNGVFIDQAQFAEVGVMLERKIRRLKRAMSRHIGDWHSDEPINWQSNKDVCKVLFDWLGLPILAKTDGGDPSTAEDNLLRIRTEHPIVDQLLELRGALKQHGTYVEGWRSKMIDGYIYPGYKIGGTVTGRPSCANPNLQQVPRDPTIRALIGAPEGWTFFEVDYSQVELRIAAAVSGEPTMLSIFRNGGDIHESTYQMIMGCTTEEAVAHIECPDERKAQLKEERKKAKAVNFGFIYGMGWRTFQTTAFSKYGLTLTDKEAKDWRKRYFETYPGLLTWHDRQRRIVHAAGQVRTFTGRIRHLPTINSPDKSMVAEAERQSINSPVQGFGAEMILMSFVEAHKYFKNNVLKLQGTIHDAMVGVVRNDVALEAMVRLKQIMEAPEIQAQFGIELPIPIIADISLGNWGRAKEFSLDELKGVVPLTCSDDGSPKNVYYFKDGKKLAHSFSRKMDGYTRINKDKYVKLTQAA